MQRKISIASLHYNEKNLFAQGIGKIIFAAAAHRNFGGSTFALLPAPSKPSEMRFLRPAQGSILARQRPTNNAFFRLFNHTYPPEQQMLHQGF